MGVYITPDNAIRRKAKGSSNRKAKNGKDTVTFVVDSSGRKLKPESELSKRQLRRRRDKEKAEREAAALEGRLGKNGKILKPNDEVNARQRSRRKRNAEKYAREHGKNYKGSQDLVLFGKKGAKVLKTMRKDDNKRVKALQRRLSSLKSVFKKEVPQIQEYLRKNDSDNAINQVQRHLVIMLVELITIAEDKYREFGNERSAYALNSLISQLRELIADIRSEEDSSNLVTRIINDALHPAFMMIGQNLVDNVYQLRKQMEIYVKPEDMKVVNDRVNEMARNISRYMEDQYNSMRIKIPQIMDANSGKKK